MKSVFVLALAALAGSASAKNLGTFCEVDFSKHGTSEELCKVTPAATEYCKDMPANRVCIPYKEHEDTSGESCESTWKENEFTLEIEIDHMGLVDSASYEILEKALKDFDNDENHPCVKALSNLSCNCFDTDKNKSEEAPAPAPTPAPQP